MFKWVWNIAAIERGRQECLTALLEAGADVNQRDQAGVMALEYAAVSNRLDSGRALLRAGCCLKEEAEDNAGTILGIHIVYCHKHQKEPRLVSLLHAAGDTL